jgi:hypothetical protein
MLASGPEGELASTLVDPLPGVPPELTPEPLELPLLEPDPPEPELVAFPELEDDPEPELEPELVEEPPEPKPELLGDPELEPELPVASLPEDPEPPVPGFPPSELQPGTKASTLAIRSAAPPIHPTRTAEPLVIMAGTDSLVEVTGVRTSATA